MARLNKTITYAILWLNSQSKDTNEIANELSLTNKQVNTVLEKHSKTKSDDTNIKTAKSNVSRSQKLMIRETAGKKNNSVSIMTGEASMLIDELKNQVANNQSRKTDSYIFRPNK